MPTDHKKLNYNQGIVYALACYLAWGLFRLCLGRADMLYSQYPPGQEGYDRKMTSLSGDFISITSRSCSG